mgnify:CR=1 FL=1
MCSSGGSGSYIKNIENDDFKEFQDIISYVWEKYLELGFELAGYISK